MTKDDREFRHILWVYASGLVFATGCVFGYCVGEDIGKSVGEKSTQVEAVKTGVAEWVPDENGKTEFRWKAAKP